jgi:hypothetical protein
VSRYGHGLFPTAEQYLVLKAALAPRAEALAAYAEWRRTLDIAAEFNYEVFRLVPLLYERLRELGVSDDLTGRLKGAYRMAWVKAQQLKEQTRPIIEGLADAGIRILAIKGSALGELYYRNPALRPMADYDLVVPESEVPTARRVLMALGYASWMPLNDDTIRFRHAMCFADARDREFDLHWHVSYDLCDDGADRWFWHGAQEFELAGRRVWAPDATRLLFHTILHGLRWNPEPPIRWIPDAVLLLRQSGDAIDWRAFVGFTEQRSVCRRIALGLKYLHDHFAPGIPAEVIERLENRPIALIERLENRTALTSTEQACRGFFGSFWVEIVPYTRYAHGKGVLAFWLGLVDYLKFFWGLPRRRDIAPYLARRFATRVRRLAHAG